MKIFLLTLLGFCLAPPLPAQGPADFPPPPRRTAEELAELLGPIALYPDALIALILPASTYPADIVLGARYVATGGNPARVEDKPWDYSVKALTRYPDTLKWMDENLEWTAQVGDAFIEQPVEVMESIQQLRAKARELGNLVDTPQQRIVQEDTYIRIIPAQPDYIYEPRYDPAVIYYERPLAGPLLLFSIGYGVGSWLNHDWDWRRHRLYRGDWNGGWDYSRDRLRRDQGDYIYINNNLTNSREWRPDTSRHHTQSRQVFERVSNADTATVRTQSRNLVTGEPQKQLRGVARPKPIAGAPHRGDRGETVRRAEQRDDGKDGNRPPFRTAQENNSKGGSKDRASMPKSVAPGLTGDRKRGSDGRDQGDQKKPGPGPAAAIRHEDAPPKKETVIRGPGDMPPPTPGSTKPDEPRLKDAPPKRQDIQKPTNQVAEWPRRATLPRCVRIFKSLMNPVAELSPRATLPRCVRTFRSLMNPVAELPPRATPPRSVRIFRSLMNPVAELSRRATPHRSVRTLRNPLNPVAKLPRSLRRLPSGCSQAGNVKAPS